VGSWLLVVAGSNVNQLYLPPCSCCLQLEQGSLGASFNGLRYALSPYQLEEALMNGQYRGEVLTGSKLRQVRWQMLVRAIDERSLASIHSDPHDGATRPPCLYFSPIANDIREIATGATFVTYVCDQNSTDIWCFRLNKPCTFILLMNDVDDCWGPAVNCVDSITPLIQFIEEEKVES
uniref:DUF1618 domain-containing protein n=1 Tax=Haemonchus contortus TaxID=6289 RepID=A0A7I4YZJ7_HAECO